jgi:putative MATE family efflux protein
MVGVEALTAVSTASPFIMLNNAVAVLGGCGAASVISRSLGRGDEKKTNEAFSNMLVVVISLTAVLVIFVECGAERLIGLSGADGSIAETGAMYLRLIFAGSFFINVSQSMNMVIRSTGKMGKAMLITSIGAILNILLDPVLIYYLPWNGVLSAALATLISQLVQFIITLCFVYRSETFHVRIKGNGISKVSLHVIARICFIGLSGMLMQLLMFFRALYLYRSVSMCGTDIDLAVMGASQRVMDLVFVIVWGISQAVTPLVGINLGAGKYDRVKSFLKWFCIYSTAACILTELAVFVLSKHILSLFIDDGDICVYGEPLLRIMYAGYFTYGIVLILITYLQTGGKPVKALVYTALWQIGLLIPCTIFMPFLVKSSNVMWICIPLSDVLAAVIFCPAVRKLFIKPGQ